MLLIVFVLLLTPSALAQTILSTSSLATCVNDGTVGGFPFWLRYTVDTDFTLTVLTLIWQTSTTQLTCSEKLIVNLVIAAGSNLVTESLDFTIPCIDR